MNVNELSLACRQKVVDDDICPVAEPPETEVEYSTFGRVPVLLPMVGDYLNRQKANCYGCIIKCEKSLTRRGGMTIKTQRLFKLWMITLGRNQQLDFNLKLLLNVSVLFDVLTENFVTF